MDRYLSRNQIFIIALIFAAIFSAFRINALESDNTKLKEGDLIRSANNPDIYIINEHNYKRLFLNPEIFSFYGHLGGFQKVKIVDNEVGESFQLSRYFRNCESGNAKVYTIELTSADSGFLHWLDISANDALSQDPNFFKKVFCINNLEFNWYIKGEDFGSLNQLPQPLKDLPQVPSYSGVLTTDLKINGSDDPVRSVEWGEELTASWTSAGTVSCTGLNYLVLKNKDTDLNNLPTSGSVTFYAKYELAPPVDTIAQILCYDKDENYTDDFILLKVKQP